MSNLQLRETITALTANGKGILAADESVPTITKRLASIQVESTEENRRAYRELLATTPGLGEYVSGVILFEETLGQKGSNGKPIPELFAEQGIVPGIKVDKGLIDLPGSQGEKVTRGLDDLAERLPGYFNQGARFAKWRAVYNIEEGKPSHQAIKSNAEMLARYAATCQAAGIVPIVEPEVLMDGNHPLERCAQVTEDVLVEVFDALHRHHVELETMLLKPNMVVAGKDYPNQPTVNEVAEATVRSLRRTVPAAVPSVNFLSGGQSAELATAHLDAMNRLSDNHLWDLSFSYGRALQDPCLKTWQGKAENVEAAQQALFQRAKLNSAAVLGQYSSAMEG